MRTLINYAQDVLPMTPDMEANMRRLQNYRSDTPMYLSNVLLVRLMKKYKAQYNVLPTQWDEYLMRAKYAVALASVYAMEELQDMSLVALRDLYQDEYMSTKEITVVEATANGGISVKKVA